MASRPSTPTANCNLNNYGPPPSVRLSPPPRTVVSADEGSESSFRVVSLAQHGCSGPWASETPICGRAGSWNGSSSTTAAATATTTATTTAATTPHGQGALDNAVFPDLDLLPLPPNHRLPPRPSELTDNSITIAAASPQRSRDPPTSRLSVLTSPFTRIAAKHARSLSSPLTLTGGVEKSPLATAPATPLPSPRSSAAATLLSNMFKTPDGSSAQPVKGGFFGFKLPSTASPRNSRTMQSTDIIDEFAGLSFASLMNSFLAEPNPHEIPSSPADALKRTPEGRLEEAIATATDLLDRVYTAYRARTASLGDALDDLENYKEDIVSHQTLNASLKTRFITEERETASRLAEQQKRIMELECELQQERRKRETADDELRLSPRRTRCTSSKRTSAASDSGFESDVDSISILSRSDARASTVVSPTEEVDEESNHHHDCESCRHQAAAAQGAETKNPTPLREAWSPDYNNRNSIPVPKPGMWGFFKGRQQQQQQGNWGDIESVRMENRWLRERVREMEKAVDGALEAVAGRGMALSSA